ncbi:hypothetical protein GCM10027074_09570 [Streptomyces deserti]
MACHKKTAADLGACLCFEFRAASDEQLVRDACRPGPQRGPAADRRTGLLQQLTKRVLESALEGEITDHVGYEKHDPTERTGRSTVSLPFVDAPSTEPQQPDQPLN